MKPFYLTTAIDYANGSPHLGHAYEKILADTVARTLRLGGREVYFRTGLDEHGTKVEKSARARGVSPQAFCDEIAGEFQALCRRFRVTNDDFIRTTEARHRAVVGEVLQKLHGQGDLYLDEYRGYYSTRQEQFLLDKDRVNGEWPEIYGEVIELVEPNYFFPLEKYRPWLREQVESSPDWIFPRFRQHQVIEFLKNPLNPLCISRPRERLAWGIPLPFDPKFVTYVWFDALVNYITPGPDETAWPTTRWPADLHIIGKDILVPPHAVYWPILLHAAHVPLPKRFLVHGFWTSGGKKESKTDIEKAKAAGVTREDPLDVAAEFGADPFRYFLLREMTLGQDAEFTRELFTARYNSELADDFGNLVSRLLNMGARYAKGEVPGIDLNLLDESQTTIRENWRELTAEIHGLGEQFESTTPGLHFFAFDDALEKLNAFVKVLNRYLEVQEPWKLVKSDDPSKRAKVGPVLAFVAEGVRLLATAYTPFMPEISARVLGLLGQPPVEQWDGQLDWSDRLTGAKLGEKEILFPKIDPKKKAEV